MIDAARGWLEEVHPSAPHLARRVEWVDALEPGARDALRIAALVRDAERATSRPAGSSAP